MKKQTKSFFLKFHLFLEHVWSLCPNLGVITLDVILKIAEAELYKLIEIELIECRMLRQKLAK